MKKFFVLLLSLFMLYASSTFEMIEGYTGYFREKAKDYYKAWAVGYCLGYYKIEDNVEFTFIPDDKRFSSKDEQEADSYVSKMVYFGGVEPLEELKAYIDEKKDYFDKNRKERCFGIFVDKYYADREIERIIKKYHIDELSPREMAERVRRILRKDKTK